MSESFASAIWQEDQKKPGLHTFHAVGPQVIAGLPIDAYHSAQTSVSKTGLDDIERSPAIFYARHLEPSRPPRPEPTAAMFAGTLGHCAILEPDEFDKRYPVGPGKTKAAKDWKDFAASLDASQTPIKQAERDMAFGMAASVRKIGPLRDALAVGSAEVSAYWRDEATGVDCRCRPDFVHTAGNGVILLDVKTTTDASPEAFAKSVANYRYEVQAGFYTDGYAAASGLPVHGFIFAAVEKDYPFAAAAYMLTEEDIEAGRRKYRRNLARYAECRESGEWPGFATDIQLITLPPWAKKD